MLVDVHTHLEFENFDKDRDEVVERAKEAGAVAIICNGTRPNYNRKILELAEKFDIVKVALGYYPCECDNVSEEEFQKELDFIRSHKSKLIAIGEIGLDKKNDNNFERQQECFREFVSMAQEFDIPVIVHSRLAEEKTIDILEEMEAKKVVMHCFSGNKKLIKRCIDNKWSFSIPCIIVRNQQFQEMVEMIPLNQLLTETDAPFLTHDASIKRNEPMYIQESLKKIAEIKGLDVKEITNIIYTNYSRLMV
ncbi:TatD family hydrolase [Candidatus Woesearchaeota archaeon]|nr:TatD family hydrolase [Candidatus Woesearchaeota archaeon]